MKKYNNSGMYVKTIFTTFTLLFILFVQSAIAAEPINVCYTTDFSGPTANIGIVQSKIVQMVVKNVNDGGGIKGRPINLITTDNGADPSKAIGNAKMFKDQYKCKVMLADITSSSVMALKGWGEANKIPMITAAPQSDKLIDVDKKSWLFRTCAPAALNVQAALARIKKLGYTKVAFEGTSVAFGTDTLATAKRYAPQYGITIVHEVLCEPKTKDLTIQVKQMKASGAEAILSAEYEAETAVLARAISAIGWKPYVLATSAADLNSALPLAEPKVYEGWETVSMADPTKPLVKKIWRDAKAFAKGTRIDEDEKAIRAYDQISLLVEALKATKNLEDSESIRDGFYNIDKNYERAAGKKGGKGGFTTAKNHLLDVSDIVVFKVKNAKITPLD